MPGDKIERQNIFSAEGNRMPPAERPMNYTGVRVERYQTAQAGRAVMGNDAYRQAIRTLNTQQRRANAQATRRQAQREARENARRIEEARVERERQVARERRAEEVRIARNARRRERRADQREARAGVRRGVDIQRRGGYNVDNFEAVQPTIMTGVERLVGQRRAYMQIVVNGEVIDQQLVDVRGGDANAIYWNIVYPFIFKYVGGQVVNRLHENIDGEGYGDDANVRFTILISDEIPNANIVQRYRDGVKHCVLEPLAMIWRTMGENSESIGSQKRCFQIMRRLEGLTATYPDGVPEGMDMEAVARVAHRCLVLHDILGNEIKRYNDKSPKHFYFTNTRINHLEEGKLTLDKNYERVSANEMARILSEHDKDDVFYLFGGDVRSGSAQTLRSVRGCWAVFNEDYDLFQEFNEITGVNKYGVDAVRHSSLNEFMLESRVINSAPTPLCDEPNDMEGVHHIDVEKAYTQHRFAPVYRGFLGHITDYVKLPMMSDSVKFLIEHIGVYQFGVLNEPCELLKMLGIFKGQKYTLPSPEIEYMIGMGLQVRLIAGAWGSTFEIDYTPVMMENRRYCTWAGKLGMDKCDNTYTFKGDAVWASCLKNMLGEDAVFFFSELGMICVRIPKKSYKTKHHILAFITSYTRMNLLETMQKVEGSLVKVVLDGLYYRGVLPDIELPIHKDKEGKKHIGFREHWYYPSAVDVSEWEAYDATIDTPVGFVPNVCVLTGAGGCGKSHSILTRKSIPKILYVVPTNVLGRKMRAKHGMDYTTIHKLIGIDCRPFHEDHYEPAVVFLDELTMIEKEWVEKALEMYPRTRFYIAGDVDRDRWYQCRNGHPGKFSEIWMPKTTFEGKFNFEPVRDGYDMSSSPPEYSECWDCKKLLHLDDKAWCYECAIICKDCYKPEIHDMKYIEHKKYYIKEYLTDYRAQDQELKDFKQKVRFVMRKVFTDGGQNDANRVAGYVRKNYKITPFDDAIAMFSAGDVWIAGTHKTNEKLLKAGVVSGYMNGRKEIVAEEEKGAEKRGSFTTHSFQGLTLETERVFVSLDFFEYAMLYTSISRVCNMSQLIIVA